MAEGEVRSTVLLLLLQLCRMMLHANLHTSSPHMHLLPSYSPPLTCTSSPHTHLPSHAPPPLIHTSSLTCTSSPHTHLLPSYTPPPSHAPPPLTHTSLAHTSSLHTPPPSHTHSQHHPVSPSCKTSSHGCPIGLLTPSKLSPWRWRGGRRGQLLNMLS